MGETALHIAAQYNDGAMIQALLASHADLEELTVDSRSRSAFGRCSWVYIYGPMDILSIQLINVYICLFAYIPRHAFFLYTVFFCISRFCLHLIKSFFLHLSIVRNP